MTFYTDPVFNVELFFCEATIISGTLSDIIGETLFFRDLEVGTSTVLSCWISFDMISQSLGL